VISAVCILIISHRVRVNFELLKSTQWSILLVNVVLQKLYIWSCTLSKHSMRSLADKSSSITGLKYSILHHFLAASYYSEECQQSPLIMDYTREE